MWPITLASAGTHRPTRYNSRASTSLDMTGELGRLYTHGGLYLALPAVAGQHCPVFAIKGPGETSTALAFSLDRAQDGSASLFEWRQMADHVPMATWVLLSKPGVVSPRIAMIIRNTPAECDDFSDWVEEVMTTLFRAGYLAGPPSVDVLLDEYERHFAYIAADVGRSVRMGTAIDVDRNYKLKCCEYF